MKDINKTEIPDFQTIMLPLLEYCNEWEENKGYITSVCC